MSTLSSIPDIDRQILSYLSPPQTLRMSEVDTYMRELVSDFRSKFAQVKFDIGEAIKHNYEPIVQWHIEYLTHTINSIKRRGLHPEDMCIRLREMYAETCFLHNNYSFASFLIKQLPRESVEYMIREYFRSAYDGTFDIGFMKHVDKCLHDTHNLKLQGNIYYVTLRDYQKVLIELFRNKQYVDAEYLISMHKFHNPMATDIFELSNKGHFSLTEVKSDAFISVCDKLNISKCDYNNHILCKSCLKKKDKHFFELIKQNPQPFDHNNIIWSACQGGHVSVAEWILADAQSQNVSIEFDKYTSIFIAEKRFFCNLSQIACYHGKLAMLEWLLKIYPKFDIRGENDQCFHLACIGGHLHVAQYLLELSNQTDCPINIHFDSDRFFRAAVHRLRFDLAEWLIVKGFESNNPFDLCEIRAHAVHRRLSRYEKPVVLSTWKKIYKWINATLDKYYDMSKITFKPLHPDSSLSDDYDEVDMDIEALPKKMSDDLSSDSFEDYFANWRYVLDASTSGASEDE